MKVSSLSFMSSLNDSIVASLASLSMAICITKALYGLVLMSNAELTVVIHDT